MKTEDKIMYRSFIGKYFFSLFYYFNLRTIYTVYKYFFRGQAVVAKRMFLPWFHIDFLWNLTDYPKKLEKYKNFAKRIIVEVRNWNLM